MLTVRASAHGRSDDPTWPTLSAALGRHQVAGRPPALASVQRRPIRSSLSAPAGRPERGVRGPAADRSRRMTALAGMQHRRCPIWTRGASWGSPASSHAGGVLGGEGTRPGCGPVALDDRHPPRCAAPPPGPRRARRRWDVLAGSTRPDCRLGPPLSHRTTALPRWCARRFGPRRACRRRASWVGQVQPSYRPVAPEPTASPGYPGPDRSAQSRYLIAGRPLALAQVLVEHAIAGGVQGGSAWLGYRSELPPHPRWCAAPPLPDLVLVERAHRGVLGGSARPGCHLVAQSGSRRHFGGHPPRATPGASWAGKARGLAADQARYLVGGRLPTLTGAPARPGPRRACCR